MQRLHRLRVPDARVQVRPREASHRSRILKFQAEAPIYPRRAGGTASDCDKCSRHTANCEARGSYRPARVVTSRGVRTGGRYFLSAMLDRALQRAARRLPGRADSNINRAVRTSPHLAGREEGRCRGFTRVNSARWPWLDIGPEHRAARDAGGLEPRLQRAHRARRG